MHRHQQHINYFDEYEWHEDAANAVKEHVVAQNHRGAERTVFHALQGQGNQRHDDQGVENDCRQDRALRGVQIHDVQLVQRAAASGGGGVEQTEHRRQDRKIF